jgi:hypothetical protein
MNRTLESLLGRIQGDFEKLLQMLDKLDKQSLEKSPAPGKWSVTQVMYHLNSAESRSIIYVSKKRLGAEQLKPTGLFAQLRLFAARFAFYLPLKFRAPNLLGGVPEHVSYEQIRNEWIKTRSELEALLNSLSDEEIRKPIFRQPTFGRWNIFQMLGFMKTHFNRHRLQMMRAIKSNRS